MSKSGSSPRKIKRVDDSVINFDSSSEEEDEEMSMEEQEKKRNLLSIEKVEDEMVVLDVAKSKEIIQIQAKYNKLRQPLYDKRSVAIKKVPNFWCNVICHHPELGPIVPEVERDCLTFLTNIDVKFFENVDDGFSIKFFFDKNPFFHNNVLVKKIQLRPIDNVADDGKRASDGKKFKPNSTSTAIDWKPGKSFLKSQQKLSLLGKRKKDVGEMTLFSWFTNNDFPFDDDIAEIFTNELWPNAMKYYYNCFEENDEGEEEEFMEEAEEQEEDDDDDGPIPIIEEVDDDDGRIPIPIIEEPDTDDDVAA
ncbi:unnamed protein product [Orchesella dallaii]